MNGNSVLDWREMIPKMSGISSFEGTPPSCSVYIVDDDPRMGKSLAWLLESVDYNVEVFDSASAFLSQFDPSKCGCIICDMRMPEVSGLDMLERIRSTGSTIPVIVITGYGDVNSAVRAMKGGAIDFLEKPVGDQALLDLVQRAVEQHQSDRESSQERVQLNNRLKRLTPREREVMELVVEGLSSKQIAARLDISFKTIESHRAKVMRKMQAKSVSHLIHMQMRHSESV